jgi:Predicted metal-dependent hydrolase with the TIM-barrel fold
MEGSNKPRLGKEMNELTILENAYIAVNEGEIFQVGVGEDYKSLVGENTKIDDVSKMLVTPGLIDSHTHLIHGWF